MTSRLLRARKLKALKSITTAGRRRASRNAPRGGAQSEVGVETNEGGSFTTETTGEDVGPFMLDTGMHGSLFEDDVIMEEEQYEQEPGGDEDVDTAFTIQENYEANNYNNRAFDENVEYIEFDERLEEPHISDTATEFDEHLEEPHISDTTTLEAMLPPEIPGLRRASERAGADKSELIPHRWVKDSIPDFELCLGLMTHFMGTSNLEWDALREILQIARDRNGQTITDFSKLQRYLKQYKKKVAARLPLLDMRVVEVPLQKAKLPTLAPSKKKEKETEGEVLTASLFFFDPISLFKTIFASELINNMHLDMAHFVDEPTELYHSHSWSGSIRTTSGHYAHFLDDETGKPGDPIFPGDFIFYVCHEEECWCRMENADENYWHIGRVYGVGKDFRSDSLRCPGVKKGHIVLQIQQAYRQTDSHNPTGVGLEPEQGFDELILAQEVTYVPQEFAIDFCKITIDTWFGEDVVDPSFVFDETKDKVPFQKHNCPPKRGKDEHAAFVVRRVAGSDGKVVPLCHTHPIRADLELKEYGRSWFVKQWDRAKGGNIVLSCPLLTFIDGFGLFRNTYRTLVGMYVTPASFSAVDRKRRANTFPLLVSPHGSIFEEVVDTLRSLIPLDRGVTVEINTSTNALMSVFTLCYTGDFPQQNSNAGCLHPSAAKFCRFCYIGKQTTLDGLRDPGEVINFDINTHGRYHHQVSEMRHYIEQLRTAKERQDYCSQWGMTTKPPTLDTIAPALDIVMTRAPDAAHSEFQGMTQLMHNLLIKAILTSAGVKQYAQMLRTWKFPAGWNRLQSPVHYLGSYNLSAHARWSIIIPGLLNFWLEEKYVNTKFGNNSALHDALEGGSVVNYVVRAFAALAKSNSVLMGSRISAEDRQNMREIITRARAMYQQLCVWAIPKGNHPARRDSDSAVSAVSTCDSSVASEVGSALGDTQEQDTMPRYKSKRRGKQTGEDLSHWATDAVRPNVHLGIHYPDFAEEYALPSNVHTLVGEDLHRYVLTALLMRDVRIVECQALGCQGIM